MKIRRAPIPYWERFEETETETMSLDIRTPKGIRKLFIPWETLTDTELATLKERVERIEGDSYEE